MEVQLKNYGDLPSLQRDLAQLVRDNKALRQRATHFVAVLATSLSIVGKKQPLRSLNKKLPGVQIGQAYKTLQELSKQSYLTNNIVAALRYNMLKDLAQEKTLQSAVELQRMIDTAWWHAYQQLSDIGKKYAPPEFIILTEKIKKYLTDKLTGRYKDCRQYITAAPSSSGLCFIANLHFTNLLDDQKYCWGDYWLSVAHDVNGYGVKTYTGDKPPLQPELIFNIKAEQVLPVSLDNMIADNFSSLQELIFSNKKVKITAAMIKTVTIQDNVLLIEFANSLNKTIIYALLPSLRNELAACASNQSRAIAVRDVYKRGRNWFVDLILLPPNYKDGRALYSFNWPKLTKLLHLTGEDVARLKRHVE